MFGKKKFFSGREEEQIINSIKAAEQYTSGEIRLFVEPTCEGDPIEKAIAVFQHLKLNEKGHRNGVLIYLATEHRKFAIIGDEGIHTKVPDNFWEDIKNKMAEFFKQGKISEGICEGVTLIGEKLKENFPVNQDDKDGYTDKINYSK
jgi:uncharacterized membrane protein